MPRCVAVGLAVWGLWRLRLRQVQRQFALVLGERARLSREIHDTLLQSLVGVALQFDAVAADVEASSARTQRQFVRMRKQVEEYIREARQSIWDLRSPQLEAATWPTALRDVGDHATAGTAGAVRPSTSAANRGLHAQAARSSCCASGGRRSATPSATPGPPRCAWRCSYEDAFVILQVTDDGSRVRSRRAPRPTRPNTTG